MHQMLEESELHVSTQVAAMLEPVLDASNTQMLKDNAKHVPEIQLLTSTRTAVLSDQIAWPTNTIIAATNVNHANPELLITHLLVNVKLTLTQVADVTKSTTLAFKDVSNVLTVKPVIMPKEDAKSKLEIAITTTKCNCHNLHAMLVNLALLDRLSIESTTGATLPFPSQPVNAINNTTLPQTDVILAHKVSCLATTNSTRMVFAKTHQITVPTTTKFKVHNLTAINANLAYQDKHSIDSTTVAMLPHKNQHVLATNSTTLKQTDVIIAHKISCQETTILVHRTVDAKTELTTVLQTTKFNCHKINATNANLATSVRLITEIPTLVTLQDQPVNATNNSTQPLTFVTHAQLDNYQTTVDSTRMVDAKLSTTTVLEATKFNLANLNATDAKAANQDKLL